MLILSLKLDADAAARLTALRTAHFPPERNYLAAHVTMFHALPPENLDVVEAALSAESRSTAEFAVEFRRPYSLGGGVAIAADAPELLALRESLRRSFENFLGPQDRQKYRPHVTIQNKVHADVAKNCLAEVTASFGELRAMARGVELWDYAGGPWKFRSLFPFSAGVPYF